MTKASIATFTLRVDRDELKVIKDAANSERRSANAFVLEAISQRMSRKNKKFKGDDMKMHIDYSREDSSIEICFSDGQYLSLNLEQADRMKQCLSAAICLALSNGENNGGWDSIEKNIECSELKKEF